jgi:L-asparaginase
VVSQFVAKKLIVLGTGGTIAGSAADASDNVGYAAAQVGVAQLLDAVPGLERALQGLELHSEQVAQVDSKDMSFSIWRALAARVACHLADPAVQGLVITHGTDTLEETAYFLHSLLPCDLLSQKPVVLTCAMRPASSQSPDGPQNLLDAVAVAMQAQAHGVVAVCAGTVHSALDVQKVHTYRLDAFSSGDSGPLAFVEEGQLRVLRPWPRAAKAQTDATYERVLAQTEWPRVEVVMNYAGAGAGMVQALMLALPGVAAVKGLVVAGTGNGTVHHDLTQALETAQHNGVRIMRVSRCSNGRVLSSGRNAFAIACGLSSCKARIALMLALMLDG